MAKGRERLLSLLDRLSLALKSADKAAGFDSFWQTFSSISTDDFDLAVGYLRHIGLDEDARLLDGIKAKIVSDLVGEALMNTAADADREQLEAALGEFPRRTGDKAFDEDQASLRLSVMQGNASRLRRLIADVHSHLASTESSGGAGANAVAEWMTLPEILDHFGLRNKADTLRKRLERWRKTHDADYREMQNQRENEARYRYRTDSIRPLLSDLIDNQ